MRKLFIVLCCMSLNSNASDPFDLMKVTKSAVAAVSEFAVTIDHAANFPSPTSSSSEEEELCDTAIANFYPEKYKSKSFYIRPFMQRLIQEQSGGRDSALHSLRRMRSGEIGPDSHISNADLVVQKLLLQAAHEALEEREARLQSQAHELVRERERLEKKMSKTYGAIITAGTSIVTSAISGFTVYLSTK